MARPTSPRNISGRPVATLFKPGGVPALAQIPMALDEFEAIRLADLEALEHAQAARRMGVSRQTFGRVLGTARRKMAQALVLGHALRIEGARTGDGARPRCPYCSHPCRATKGPEACAACAPTLVTLGPARRARAGGHAPAR
jgi:predicted DNA-binding protein (UPF0251 family)